MNQPSSQDKPETKIKILDAAGFWLFLFLWILPLCYRGLANRIPPGMPTFLSYLHNTTRLFIQSTMSWRADYLQVQLAGSTDWKTLSEDDYFTMRPFGHRTRLHQYLSLAMLPRNQKDAYCQELAEWVRRRYVERHPSDPAPAVFRIVMVNVPIDREPPEGHWKNPPLEAFDPQETWVMHEQVFGKEDR